MKNDYIKLYQMFVNASDRGNKLKK